MTSMSRRFAIPAAWVLLGISGALASASASAGVLYKCEGPNGSIAYTNKTATFTKCVELSRYADESKASSGRHSSKKATARPNATRHKCAPGQIWVYGECVKL